MMLFSPTVVKLYPKIESSVLSVFEDKVNTFADSHSKIVKNDGFVVTSIDSLKEEWLGKINKELDLIKTGENVSYLYNTVYQSCLIQKVMADKNTYELSNALMLYIDKNEINEHLEPYIEKVNGFIIKHFDYLATFKPIRDSLRVKSYIFSELTRLLGESSEFDVVSAEILDSWHSKFATSEKIDRLEDLSKRLSKFAGKSHHVFCINFEKISDSSMIIKINGKKSVSIKINREKTSFFASEDYITKKFHEFNSIAFDGELTLSFPIILEKLKESRLGYITANTRTREIHSFRINDSIDWCKESLDETILHEMIHVWQYQIIEKPTKSHGKEFKDKAKYIVSLGLPNPASVRSIRFK